MDRLWESGKDEISKLDRMVWQRVHKVEMEVTQELRVVFEDDQNDVHGSSVKAAHGWR